MQKTISFTSILFETEYHLSFNRRFLLTGLILLIGATTACASSEGEGADEPLANRVVVTIYPLWFFTSEIGGDAVVVRQIVPQGVEAHDFEPSVNDMREISEAGLLIYNGKGFEPWVDRAMDSFGSTGPNSLAVAEFTDGAESDASRMDPHGWLDPVQAIAQVNAIRDTLVEAVPEASDILNTNSAALVQKLQELHDAFQTRLSSCRKDTFITSHRAFSHLGARYGLTELSLAGLSPDDNPSPGDLVEIGRAMEAESIGHVMFEPIGSRRFSETVARENGAELLPLHPLESLSESERESDADYMDVMYLNLESLAMALDCE